MAFSRVAALRSSLRTAARPSTFSRTQLWRQTARRGYSSGGHAKSAGGDAVWAAGAVAVTVPSCWYLLQNGPDTAHHGGHDDHGKHGDSHHEEKEEDESKDEEPKEEEAEAKSDDGEKSEEKTEEKSEEKSEDKDSKSDDSDSDDSKDAETPASSDIESEGETDKNKVTSSPDAKGGNKKKLESKQSIKQGEVDDSDTSEDKAASSKEAGGKDTQSGKQEGLSNTDTKHSTDIVGDSDKSTKGEGAPETAKLKGTVDPKRPQV